MESARGGRRDEQHMDSTSRVNQLGAVAADSSQPTRVLFLAYEFPPLGGAGIRRSLILSRHLPEFGIEPVVVTTDLASYQRDKADLVDLKLLERVPPGLVIERIPTRAARNQLPGKLGIWSRSFFTLTDNVASRWQAEVERRLPDLITLYQPKAIYVTLPPFSMAEIACAIGKIAKLPVLLDFRDSWSQCGHTPYMSRAHYRIVLGIERACLQQAAAVVCVTEQIKRDMLATHASADAAKFRVIPNGFDGEIPVPNHAVTPGENDQPFVIGHVGSFYYSPGVRQVMVNSWWRRKPTRWTHFSPRKEDWLYRSPHFFFRALARLFGRKPELRKRIRVRFVGAHPDWLREQVREFNLSDVVEFLGFLNHEDCLAFQAASDCLLITSAKVIGGEDYCISSKSFEYITTGKPVLAVTAAGAQRDFFAKSGVAQVCDPDDPEATAAQIEKLVLGQVGMKTNREFLARFQGRAISRAVAEVLQELVRPRNGGWKTCSSESLCAEPLSPTSTITG